MHFRMGLKLCLHYFILIISIICLSTPAYTGIELSSGNQTEYTYYGIVPSKLYRYNLTDGHDPNSGWQLQSSANRTLLTIVATNDGTNIRFYDLTLGKVETRTINSLEMYSLLLANGTFFKVVSDKIVSVSLLNVQSIPAIPPPSNSTGPTPHTFYTSTDGLCVGKEFVFMASEATSADYTVLALEKATVTVTRDDNTQFTFSIDVNSYKNTMLSNFRIYKITSTGNIMVQSGPGDIPGYGGDAHCFYVPSAEGGFVGTFFLTRSVKEWDVRMDFGYRVSALKDTIVKVFDLETKQLIKEYPVEGGIGVAFKPKAEAIAVQSDKPITLLLTHNGSIEQTHPLAGGNPKVGEYSGYSEGVTFIGVRPEEETQIYLPVNAQNNVFFFASEDTQITIDDEITQTISADSYHLFTIPGTHKITSNKNIIVQITHWNGEPDYQGIWFTGAIIPCIQTVDVNPTVTLTSLEGGFPLMYIIIGAGTAAAAVIVAILVMRKRGGKSS